MSHKPKASKASAELAAPRRIERRVMRRAVAVAERRTMPRAKESLRHSELVYAVKCEVRSPATGHPLVEPPLLAVDEVYRHRLSALAKMREIVDSEIAFEMSRARTNPHSPAWLNAIRPFDSDAESVEVTRADGMIVRYFVDGIPLL